jgi:16S rRNA (guanine966-N2)-methyltransferase
MRILSGRWAGRDLTSPGGRVRPTSEDLRGAWLDRLGPHLTGARVLDLYSGTGALGLEALSRGAKECDFVENGPGALHALKANVAKFKLKGQARVFRRDARLFPTTLAPAAYDICLADPPYTSKLAIRLAEMWAIRPFAGILGVEHDASLSLPDPPEGATVDRIEHDSSAVTLYLRV